MTTHVKELGMPVSTTTAKQWTPTDLLTTDPLIRNLPTLIKVRELIPVVIRTGIHSPQRRHVA